MKRFWTEVSGRRPAAIALDGTAGAHPRPRCRWSCRPPALAEAVAAEWRAVGETIDPRAMPLTGLANAAIDRIAPDPAAFAAGLAAMARATCSATAPKRPLELVARQAAAWDPLLDWARAATTSHSS